MKKDFQWAIWLFVLAIATLASSCATEAQRPYNSVVLGLHTVDSTQGLSKENFLRVEYYTHYTDQIGTLDSLTQVNSRVFVYKSAIEMFSVFPDGDVIHSITQGDWLDEYTFRSKDGLEYYIFNEEYLDVTSTEFHFELIK